jgi:hypothetical protein
MVNDFYIQCIAHSADAAPVAVAGRARYTHPAAEDWGVAKR